MIKIEYFYSRYSRTGCEKFRIQVEEPGPGRPLDSQLQSLQ